jgi:hypothetical protein
LEYSEADEGGWGSELDKKKRSGSNLPLGSKAAGMVAEHAPNTLKGVPTGRARRWWLLFLLRAVGRTKRPDIQLAWREKVMMFVLILLLNGTIMFHIVEFGRLLARTVIKSGIVLNIEATPTSGFLSRDQSTTYPTLFTETIMIYQAKRVTVRIH